MLNVIWVAMMLIAVLVGAMNGRLKEVANASTTGAGSAVTLALGLIGVMSLWLGLMRVLQQAGVMRAVARALRPGMARLFPDVPVDHPAMGMMIMNITANMLGLGNAATPFGLKAMAELDKLNPRQGEATNAMVLFLAINTAGVALLPTGMIAVRATLGSQQPGSIFLPTLIATIVSMTAAILAVKLLERLPMFATTAVVAHDQGGAAAGSGAAAPDTREAEEAINAAPPPRGPAYKAFAALLCVATAAAFGYAVFLRASSLEGGVVVGWGPALRGMLSDWMLIVLLTTFLLIGVVRGVKIYDALVEGGKEGFAVAQRIIPYLVAMFVAIQMLREAGAIDAMVRALAPVTGLVGMPAETLPMAILRPLSGSGAFGVASELMKQHGPDSLIGNIAATMQGSTETTFYVLALYFGVVGVKQTRHTLPACIFADVVGLLMAVWTCLWLLT